jgi:toxin ParE1/3/4
LRLRFAAAAARDLESILDYIALDSPAGAESVGRAVMAAGERLTTFPDMGRPGRLPGTREFSLPGLPYLLVYEADSDALTILAVFHGARDLARALTERRRELKR